MSISFRVQEELKDTQLLLNAVGGALAGYSTRKLRSAYSGAAIRVREDDGDTEADIGFSGGGLDTAALLAHCGANSGYITKFYDQGLNGWDIVQAAEADQPCVAASGVVNYGLNAKVCLDFANNKLVSVGVEGTHRPDWGVPHTTFMLVSPDTLDSEGALDDYFMGKMQSSLNGGLVIGVNRATSEFRQWVYDAGAPLPSANITGHTGWRLISAQAEADSKARIAENGDDWTESDDTVTGWSAVPTMAFALGSRPDQANAGYRLDGKIHEVIMYPSILSAANVAKCKANINAYYEVW